MSACIAFALPYIAYNMKHRENIFAIMLRRDPVTVRAFSVSKQMSYKLALRDLGTQTHTLLYPYQTCQTTLLL